MKKQRQLIAVLCAAVVLLYTTAWMAASRAQERPTQYYDIQVRATRQLEQCFAAVKGYKQELGIAMSPEDRHQTGILGPSYSEITTTLGAPEAKRTTAWPDMAALCVRLLHEAGVRPGDTVGAGLSGSFPGMNLALVAACESMGVRLICIPSVGASTYGANDPELTFPEMLFRLEQDGLIRTQIPAVTMGGNKDIGTDMEPGTAQQIRERLKELGLNLVEQPDFLKNIAWREELYADLGPISCFVAVGGNVTSLGRGEVGISLGQGVLRSGQPVRPDESSGLVQRYQAKGLPVINLLNIKRLVADYGLPYDPAEWPEIGQSAVYYQMYAPKEWLALGLLCGSGLILACGLMRYRPDKNENWK